MTFDQVAACGLTLPNVELSTKYDGSPVLKVHGSFMAGLAMHASSMGGKTSGKGRGGSKSQTRAAGRAGGKKSS